MTTSTFNYPKEFQIKALSCLFRSFTFFAQVNDYLHPEYFEDEVLSFFCRKIYMCYREFKTAPTEEILKLEIQKATEKEEILSEALETYLIILSQIIDQDFEEAYVQAEVQDFVKFQVYKDSLTGGIELLKEKDYDRLDALLQVATSLRFDEQVAQEYFKEVDDRLVRRSKSQSVEIPTLIPGFDRIIRGGIRVKEMAVIAGLPNVGKSIFLVNVAKGAIICGFKVIYYTLEMSADDVADRFDSTFSGIIFDTLMDKASIVRGKIQKLHGKYGNSLYIKEYPSKFCSPDTIRAHIKGLIDLGFFPDLVIVDYADLLRPNRTYNQRRFELESIYTDLRSMAMEFPVAMWTASQLNKLAKDEELIGIGFTSEAFAKEMIADIVVSINQTKQEEDTGMMRLHTVKNRYAKKGRVVAVKNAFGRMQFGVRR